MICFKVNWEKYYIGVIGKGPVAELGRVRSRNWEGPVPIGNGSVYRTRLKKEKKRCIIYFIEEVTYRVCYRGLRSGQ